MEHIEKNITLLRLAAEFTAVLRGRVPILQEAVKELTRSFHGVFPTAGEFIHIPEVKAIIDPRKTGVFTAETLNTLRDQLPEIVARWKIKYHEELGEYLKLHVRDIIPLQSQAKDLALAHTIYCTICHHVFSTSDMSAAAHVHPIWHWHGPPLELGTVDRAYWRAAGRCWLYPTDFWRFKVPYKCVMKILEACGKGPLTTVQELDDLDPRFICLECDNGPRPRTIYTRRDAVSHS